MTHAFAARALLATFFVVIVGVRALVQMLRTRDHGLRVRHARTRIAVVADAFWVATTIAFTLAVILDPAHVARAPHVAIGATVAVCGIALAFMAQIAMGASWRIGLQPGEKTTLVQHGPFRVVRNPIYTSVLIFLAGLMLLVPSALMIGSWVAAVIGVEMQVRLVEEPHLLALHGDAYRAYAGRVGRLFPYVGRLGP